MSEDKKWKCALCGVEPVNRKTIFNYMGRNISYEVPVCPKCGKVFISKELAEGKMTEVEEQLEDK